MDMIALAPLCGEHEPQFVRTGGRFRATEEVAYRLMAAGLAVPAAYLAPDDDEIERAFTEAAQAATATAPQRRRR